MRNILILLTVLLLTSCGTTYQLSTLNHDPIYDGNGNEIEINVINSQSQFDRLLRTDFTFRYNYAQYALSQPRSFDWNNRILGNRFNFYNPYGFNSWNTSYMSRDMMWNDWVWGYNGWNSWGSPHRWSPFGYDRWGYNIHYGWNNHGWGYNGYYGNGWGNYGWNGYGQNNWYGRQGRDNVSYINGRRGSTMSIQDRIGNAAMIESSKRSDLVINREVIKLKKDNPNIRIINNTNNVPIIIRNNNTPVRNYNRIENSNNNIRNNNTPVRNNNNIRNNNTPVRTYSPPPRSTTPVRTSRSGTVKNNKR